MPARVNVCMYSIITLFKASLETETAACITLLTASNALCKHAEKNVKNVYTGGDAKHEFVPHKNADTGSSST